MIEFVFKYAKPGAKQKTCDYVESEYKTEKRIGSPNLTDATELKKLKMFPHLHTIDLSNSRFPDFQIDGNLTLKDILPAVDIAAHGHRVGQAKCEIFESVLLKEIK